MARTGRIEYQGDEARFDRALDLVQNNATWRRVCRADGTVVAYAIPSGDRVGVWYETTPSSCTCPDRKYRGKVCKHMTAAQMYVEMKRAEAATKTGAAA